MASDISKYSQNIDTNFPVKGQDNPSQGFRDNFAQIRLALDTAATEISSVQYLYTATSYVLPKATDEVLGGIKVGSNITVSDGVISVAAPYSLPTASTTTQGGVIIGDNITVLGDGTISVATPYVLTTATTSTLGGVLVGSGLAITGNAILNLDLPLASTSILGGVKIGENLVITTGTLSFNTGTLVETAVRISSTATTSTLGGVKIGANINAAIDGTISVANPYVLPNATTSTAGGVKVGTGINLSSGTISVTPYTLPIASVIQLGGIIPDGTSVSVSAEGILSQVPYVLPTAAPTQLGGIKVGNNLSIDGSGFLSVTHSTATTVAAGVVKVGNNLHADGDGTLSVSNPYVLSSYTTATLNTIISTQTGAMVYVSNAPGGAQPCYFVGAPTNTWFTVNGRLRVV
jgi:hypothetical protein